MAQFPHELIRQVQIRTRAAAALPDYDPSDPTLPTLPPLSATIAATDDASPPDLRCRNCKALLLRGSESIVCLYCGLGPHYDAVPDPIRFTSTVGYKWLLRSLRLDGSEMVDPTSKSNQGKSQISSKDLTPLSAFLSFKIPWPAETVKEDTSSDKSLEESKRSLILTGIAPDKFFLKPKSNELSDTPTERSFDHKWAEAKSTEDVAALGNQDLFGNVQSSKPVVSSSDEHTTSKVLSGWEADFQFPDSENQLGGVTASLEGSGIKFEDPESFKSSSSVNVDLGAHLDSVFGENLNDGRPKESSVPTAAVDWNSDDMWNTLGSSKPNTTISEGFDATFSTKSEPQNDHTLDFSKDLSTSIDLFQEFQSKTNDADMTENKAKNEDHSAMDEDFGEDWNDFASSSNVQVSTFEDKPLEGDIFSFDNKLQGDSKFLEGDLFSFEKKFEDDKKPAEQDLFSFNNKLEGDEKSPDGDFFSFDNTLEGDKKSSKGDLFSFEKKSEDDKKPSEGDLFGLDNKLEDAQKSSERDLFSFDFDGDFTSTSNSNALAEGNTIMSEDPTSNWFSDMSTPSLESGISAKNEGAMQSSEDHVKMLISQMHDLSFMLDTDLSIPSRPDKS